MFKSIFDLDGEIEEKFRLFAVDSEKYCEEKVEDWKAKEAGGYKKVEVELKKEEISKEFEEIVSTKLRESDRKKKELMLAIAAEEERSMELVLAKKRKENLELMMKLEGKVQTNEFSEFDSMDKSLLDYMNDFDKRMRENVNTKRSLQFESARTNISSPPQVRKNSILIGNSTNFSKAKRFYILSFSTVQAKIFRVQRRMKIFSQKSLQGKIRAV